MAEYYNIFNQVQVQGPPELGMDNGRGLAAARIGTPRYSTLIGWLGNAQLGPIYLGWFGVISLATGFMWFFIIGLNMLVQVGFSIPRVHPPAVLAGARAAEPGVRAAACRR